MELRMTRSLPIPFGPTLRTRSSSRVAGGQPWPWVIGRWGILVGLEVEMSVSTSQTWILRLTESRPPGLLPLLGA